MKIRKTKRITILLAVPLLCGLIVSNAFGKPSAKDYLRRGDFALGRNNIVKAIRNYTKAIQIDPLLAEAYVRRGIALRAKGSLNQAIQDFENAEKIDPQATSNNQLVADSYSYRGYTEMNELELGSAIEDLTKAIKSHEDALHYYRRGQARLLDEDFEGAVNDFSKALTLDKPNDLLRALIYANRGYARMLQGRQEEARNDLMQGTRRNSGQHVLVELDLRMLEMQITEIRHRRLQARRNIS
jgi:tetratricopeptide (TPR) repeat protein